MTRYDIAIIGTGPAGLEAAITARARNKSILLLGSKTLSIKVERAHTIRNYLGLPEISGTDLQAACLGHIRQMGVSITEDQVNMVYAMGDYFAIQGRQDMYEATTVILACGMPAANPIPGETEHLGRGVSYCATCDGALYRGKKVTVIAYTEEAEQDAAFLADLASEVTYINMTAHVPADKRLNIIRNMEPVGIYSAYSGSSGTSQGLSLELPNHSHIYADGVFIFRSGVVPSQLVPGLRTIGNKVWVDRDHGMRTNIPRLYACGDITGAPYQYIKAAGEGNVAALSAVTDLFLHKL